MATHGTALSLYNAQLARFKAVKLQVGQATKVMASDGAADLRELTSSKISSATLAKMGHPYGRGTSAGSNLVNAGNVGRRRGTSAGSNLVNAPLRPVNAQTGRLRSSVRMTPSGVYRYDVSISAPYARYIMHPSGTKYMVGRGVMSWHDVNRSGPTGEITKRHRLRLRAYRDSVRKVQAKP